MNIDGSWNARLAKRPLLRKLFAALGVLPSDKAGVPWSRDIFVHDMRKPPAFCHRFRRCRLRLAFS